MKALAIFRKTLREASRDRLIVILTLAFAPFFILLFWLAIPATVPAYRVGLLDLDQGAVLVDGSRLEAGRDLAEAIRGTRDANGRPVLDVVELSDRATGLRRLGQREFTALVVLPADFSRALAAARAGGSAGATAMVSISGDLTSPLYAVTAMLAGAALDTVARSAAGQTNPIAVLEEPLGGSASRTEFEVYVPGIIVFAVILLLFYAAMAVTRDIEAGTLRRMRLARMTSLDYLAGTSAVLVLIALAGVVLTFVTATLVGFTSRGPLWVAVLVTAMTAVSVIGVGLMVAAFSRTVAQAFVIANFPLGILMFFSGSMFPMPQLTLFTLAGHSIGPFEVLPPTHAVAALNRIFTLGAGFGDVAFELAAIGLLSTLYFGIGVLLLRRVES